MTGRLGSSPAFHRVLPFALFIAFLAAQPLLEARFDGRDVVIVRGLAVAGALGLLWRHYKVDFAGPRLSAGGWAGAVAAGIAVFAAWITLDQGWAVMGEPGTGFVPVDGQGRLDATLVALRLAQLALVVPLMEELFWRSFLLRWIDGRDFLRRDPRQASALAFAASAGLFALEHSQWLAGLVAGLAYTALYVRTGSLWAPLAAHAVTNALLGAWIVATGSWRYW